MKNKKGHRQRQIEKFLNNSRNFNMKDIVEILLFICLPRIDTKSIAEDILKDNNSLISIFNQPTEIFLKIKNINKNTVMIFKLIYEIALRIIEEKISKKNVLEDFLDLINYSKLLVSEKTQEEMYIIYLNIKNQIIKTSLINKGNLNSVNVDNRAILQSCILNGASSIILLHNHPSGDPMPSKEDILITNYLIEMLKYISVKVIDHIIIGGSDFTSMRQNGTIKF
jgi:DNA repair protein RadC